MAIDSRFLNLSSELGLSIRLGSLSNINLNPLSFHLCFLYVVCQIERKPNFSRHIPIQNRLGDWDLKIFFDFEGQVHHRHIFSTFLLIEQHFDAGIYRLPQCTKPHPASNLPHETIYDVCKNEAWFVVSPISTA